MFPRIVAADFQFIPSRWSSISDDAKDLIRGLLEPNPEKRLTAGHALNHQWLKVPIKHLSSRHIDIGELEKFQSSSPSKKDTKDQGADTFSVSFPSSSSSMKQQQLDKKEEEEEQEQEQEQEEQKVKPLEKCIEEQQLLQAKRLTEEQTDNTVDELKGDEAIGCTVPTDLSKCIDSDDTVNNTSSIGEISEANPSSGISATITCSSSSGMNMESKSEEVKLAAVTTAMPTAAVTSQSSMLDSDADMDEQKPKSLG